MKKSATLSVLLVFAGAAYGSPITTFFNTGVDASGSLLIGGNGIIDPHWTVTSGSTTTQAVTYFNPSYLPDGSLSRWISIDANGGSAAGDYVFHTTFDLNGFNPAASSLTFNCGVDNITTNVQLNGVSLFGVGSSCDNYTVLGRTHTISSNFLGGLNTLDFTIHNDDIGPLAFRAQFTSDTTPITSAVPEPSTLLISGSGLALLLLGFAARRPLRGDAVD